jgi:thiol-disulfide isomerase/thioredoxin
MSAGPVRRWAAAVLLASSAALAGCAPEPDVPDPVPQVGRSSIDVDTPALRAAKRQAGIETCRPGTTSNGLPAVTLPCLGGGPPVDLASLPGPLVVNVWGSYCAPCKRELPIYQAFAKKYAGAVGVLGVDFTDNFPDRALELAATSGVTYPQVADPDGELSVTDQLPRMTRLPFLTVIDERGRVVAKEFVPITSLAQLEGLIEKALGRPLRQPSGTAR